MPDIAAGRIAAMFEAAGWQTITVKYGRWLRELFERPRRWALRRRIDEMPNEEYQRLLRSTAGSCASGSRQSAEAAKEMAKLIAELSDDECCARFAISADMTWAICSRRWPRPTR